MPSVLVTGASRGIGRAVSSHLAARGWEVYGGVRRHADGDRLVNERITPIQLDVTDAQQIAGLDGVLPEGLDAVVNNAGIAIDGPVEGLATSDIRRQLEVNVVGQLAVTQALLPRLRRSHGRVVFVSSTSGRIAVPWLGAYVSSKFALEGLADTLRMEVRPWGIHVILVQPSNTDTDLWRGASAQLDTTVSTLSEEHRSLYAHHIEGMRRAAPVMLKTAVPADRVARTVERALTDHRPRARYPVGGITKAQLFMMAVTPTRVRDAVIARLMGVKA